MLSAAVIVLPKGNAVLRPRLGQVGDQAIDRLLLAHEIDSNPRTVLDTPNLVSL